MTQPPSPGSAGLAALTPSALSSRNLVPDRFLIVVSAVAVLLPGVLSFGDDTVALLVIVPGGTAGMFTTLAMIVRGGAEPTARGPPVRLQVIVVVPEQAHGDPDVEKRVVPAGSVSTTLTAAAGSGPAFVTLIV